MIRHLRRSSELHHFHLIRFDFFLDFMKPSLLVIQAVLGRCSAAAAAFRRELFLIDCLNLILCAIFDAVAFRVDLSALYV